MTHLKEGDKAPAFTGLNEKGEEVSLSDYKGKKLILFFYPKDNTPGCTAEACNLRDNYDQLRAQGFELLGVSPDSAKTGVLLVTVDGREIVDYEWKPGRIVDRVPHPLVDTDAAAAVDEWNSLRGCTNLMD